MLNRQTLIHMHKILCAAKFIIVQRDVSTGYMVACLLPYTFYTNKLIQKEICFFKEVSAHVFSLLFDGLV